MTDLTEGIEIESSGDQVEGCYVGTDASGTAAVPNSGGGIVVDATGATIGGTASGDANVISGNEFFTIAIDATDCLMEGNKIGTNVGGTAAVPNFGDGILVFAMGATIGGTAAGDANVISGNRGTGIDIDAPCLVEGNDIGTDAGGTAAVPNSDNGIFVDASGATIGGTASGDANVISGNGGNGVGVYIGLSDATDCLVEGNKIGTNAGGTAAVPNSYDGISVFAPGATIGGTASGDANVISGNGFDGIDIVATDCLVEGNEIGTDAGGTAAVANSGNGIFVFAIECDDRRDGHRAPATSSRATRAMASTSTAPARRTTSSRGTISAPTPRGPSPWRTSTVSSSRAGPPPTRSAARPPRRGTLSPATASTASTSRVRRPPAT